MGRYFTGAFSLLPEKLNDNTGSINRSYQKAAPSPPDTVIASGAKQGVGGEVNPGDRKHFNQKIIIYLISS